MLRTNVSRNQFLFFSIYSLCLSFVLGILVIREMNTPLIYAETQYLTPIHIKNTKILVFGDMMLDRAVRQKINENGPEYPFLQIKDYILNNDIVVANAEGSFTFFDSVTVGKKGAPLNFTFDPLMLNTLKDVGFTLLGQANNHTLNFGLKGFAQSTTSIILAGLNYFGDPQNKNIEPYIKEINGEKIGFVAYNEFSYQGKDNVIKAIQETKKQTSYLIVYPHWGVEYNQSFTGSQQKVAHEFIDAGADAVIGMHPHVIEPIEIYNGKPIFYSIGNFIFDQAQTGPKSEGLAIKIVLNKKSITYEINPFSITHAQASLMDATSSQIILNSLSESSITTNAVKENIASGTIKIVR